MRLSFLTLCAIFSGHLLAAHPAMPAPDVEPPVPTDCAAIADFLEGQVMVMTHTAVYGEACFTIQSLLHFGTDGQANELDNQGQFLGSFPYLVTEVDGQCALARDAADCAVQFLSFNGDQTQVIMSRNGSDASLQPSDCPFPPSVTAATLASATSSLTAQDGALTVTAEVGFSTSLPIASIELAGINGSTDYSFPMPGPVEGIGAGLYSVSALDGSDCESEAVTVLVPYDLCCACGVSDADVDGLCDDEDNCANRKAINYADPANVPCIIPGCMDPAFIQYDADATEDNGSCTTPVVEGCTDPAYLEFDASANTDDGSCTTPQIAGCTDPNYQEYDATATVDDGSCANLHVLGCTDPLYSEYDPFATQDNGTCVNPAIPGCTDPAYVEYDDTATTDDGSCANLIDPNCVSPTMDGYTYDVVQIGGQCWFAENLRTTIYADGTVIPAGLTDGEWTTTTSGATAVYGEGSTYCYNNSPDIDACDEAQSLAEYGRLYNWYAVDDARGLCPSGWHVPTDGEWMVLEMELGMSESVANSTGWRGTDEATQLKSTSGWSNNGNGTDDFGFSALPGGFRSIGNGFFYRAGDWSYRWTSSPYGVYNGWLRILDYDNPATFRGGTDPQYGCSVRCLRDAD